MISSPLHDNIPPKFLLMMRRQSYKIDKSVASLRLKTEGAHQALAATTRKTTILSDSHKEELAQHQKKSYFK